MTYFQIIIPILTYQFVGKHSQQGNETESPTCLTSKSMSSTFGEEKQVINAQNTLANNPYKIPPALRSCIKNRNKKNIILVTLKNSLERLASGRTFLVFTQTLICLAFCTS